MNKIKYVLMMILLLHFGSGITMAQSKWYVNTSMQMVGSDFQDGTNHNSFYFYNGIRYQTQSFYLGLNIPIVFIDNNILTQTTNLDNNMNSGGMSSMSIGLGDFYLNSSLELLNETGNFPSISLDGYVKIPASSQKLGIGTDKFDAQLAFGLRKFVNKFSLFAQFGYLFLGKIENAEIINPITISLGIGYTFGYGEHSILLAYDSYSTIIKSASSPKQLAFGYNYMINSGLFFTGIVSSGLSNSTSNYTISGGLNIEL